MKLAVLPHMDSCQVFFKVAYGTIMVYFKQFTYCGSTPQQPMATPVIYIYTKLAPYFHEELLCIDSLHLAHKPGGGF